MLQTTDARSFLLEPHDWVPNNPRLPVLIYHAVVTGTAQSNAARLEQIFRWNGWEPQWRDGIYDYHHYHSTAHEALGVAGGSARLMLGGPQGTQIMARPGDVLVLPAGTGHCSIEASRDFLVVGAYPKGQAFDICRTQATAEMLARIAAVEIPDRDPVQGVEGKLPQAWKRA